MWSLCRMHTTRCPHCRKSLQIPAPLCRAGLLRCRFCSGQFQLTTRRSSSYLWAYVLLIPIVVLVVATAAYTQWRRSPTLPQQSLVDAESSIPPSPNQPEPEPSIGDVNKSAFPVEPVSLQGKGKKAEKSKTPKELRDLPSGWFTSYDRALAHARSAKKPLLVLFH